MKKRQAKTRTATGANRIRIIGGQWRGRSLQFPTAEGLRPTNNRIRETLFNWLAPYIHGSHCLDLFCGSGALGFEAMSRGASAVTFVDINTACIEQLRVHATTLGTQHAEFVCQDAHSWLLKEEPNLQRFDVIFLDPPFNQPIFLSQCLTVLSQPSTLKSPAWIYTESTPKQPVTIGNNWQSLHDKVTGNVRYNLFRTQQ